MLRKILGHDWFLLLKLNFNLIAVVVVTIAFFINPTWQYVAALAIIFANYSHQRLVEAARDKRSRLDHRHKKVAEEIYYLQKRLDEFQALTETVQKQSEEAKKVLSQLHLGQAFNHQTRR